MGARVEIFPPWFSLAKTPPEYDDPAVVQLNTHPLLSAHPSFNDRSLRTQLQRCGFEDEHLSADFQLGDRTIPLFAFAHRPFDTRTACITATSPAEDRDAFLKTSRDAGAPLAFIGTGQRWSVWQITTATPVEWWSADRGNLEAFFAEYRNRLDPRSIFRAKTATRDQAQQLSFVDAGLLEMVEAECGDQVCGLIERMILTTREKLHLPALKQLEEMEAQMLVQANFWLLAARLLQDKQVQGFKTLDLKDLDNVFNRVGKHYGSRMRHDLTARRRKALTAAASILNAHGSLRLVSTETLGRVYENVLITKETRKALGTHSTPTWLVDYMVQRLAPWIEELPESRRCVYEPGCGHAPFLVALLRQFSGMNPCLAMTDADRHAWLQARLVGAETDDFAREVARLSLTLADIPNPNGWELDEGNMFSGGNLESRIRNAGIIISNPPFETRSSEGDELFHLGQAAELLRRINLHAQPGTLLAYIMPQTILDSKKATALRRDLLNRFEWLEILRLPDKVFDKADVETAVIIGRRLHDDKRAIAPVRIKHVWDDKLSQFIKSGTPTIDQQTEASVMQADPLQSMLVPDLEEVWNHCAQFGKLKAQASAGQGFIYKSESDPSYPHGMPKRVEKKQAGYRQGFYDLKDTGMSHQLPRLSWLLFDPKAIDRTVAGCDVGNPQVVMNHARVSRGPWRNIAYMDEKGHPARGRFLVVRPNSNAPVPLHPICLWAILNSPLANAFTKSYSSKRDILSGIIEQLPLPEISDVEQANLGKLARSYIEMASKAGLPSQREKKKHPQHNQIIGGLLPGLDLETSDQADDEERLKHLHWKLDAAVLALYKIPPQLERQLLDFFTFHKRVGVPFHQTEYYPAGFQGAHTLAELLSITADWETNNTRRLELIDREYDDKLRKAEAAELERLQHLAMLRRRLVAPFPLAEQDAEIERLKREGKWSE